MKKHLTTNLVKELLDKENEHALDVSGHGITHIDDIDDERMKSIRRLDVSFNLITSLRNISAQFPQLRHLSAYCCQIESVDDLMFGGNKLEYLLLQQNGIDSIPKAFQSLIKLKELRLDQNKLTTVKNLSSCSSLKHLNLAYNRLTSIVGIEGLQSLEVLILRNNRISSLKDMKLLPSLNELDVSYNSLQSLEGIQILPILEIVRADHNSITSLLLPRNYALAASASVQQSSKTNPSPSAKKSRTAATKTVGQPTEHVTGSMQSSRISELFLSHNLIRDLQGIECYGPNVEILDISHNHIETEIDLVKAFNGSHTLLKLTEINLCGNPCIDDSTASIEKLTHSLLKYSPSLNAINSFGIHMINDAGSDAKQLSGTTIGINFTLVSHKERNPESCAVDRNDDVQTYSIPSGQERDFNESTILDSDNEAEKEQENFLRGDVSAPRLHFKNIKSLEEIRDKETIFRGLLDNCRVALASIMNLSEERPISSDKPTNLDSGVHSRGQPENPESRRLLNSCSAISQVSISPREMVSERLSSKLNGYQSDSTVSGIVKDDDKRRTDRVVDMIPPTSAELPIHSVVVVQRADGQDGSEPSPVIVSATSSSREDNPAVQFLKQRQLRYQRTNRSAPVQMANPAVIPSTASNASGHTNTNQSDEQNVGTISIGFDVRLRKY
jgi:Leucine-rich repeat (LRR) protein